MIGSLTNLKEIMKVVRSIAIIICCAGIVMSTSYDGDWTIMEEGMLCEEDSSAELLATVEIKTFGQVTGYKFEIYGDGYMRITKEIRLGVEEAFSRRLSDADLRGISELLAESIEKETGCFMALGHFAFVLVTQGDTEVYFIYGAADVWQSDELVKRLIKYSPITIRDYFGKRLKPFKLPR